MSPLARSPWREPMLWFAGALPLAVLVAAAATIAIARGGDAGRGEAGVRRIAQMQLEDLGPDREAARLGRRAHVDADAPHGTIALRIEPPAADDESIELAMLHPARHRDDRSLVLHRDGELWRAVTLPWPASQAWEMRLRARDGGWRIGGRLTGGATQAELVPAVVR